MTREQYLELDERAERPSEYYAGEMFELEPTTLRHAKIQLNLGVKLSSKLEGAPCSPLGSTIRVLVPVGHTRTLTWWLSAASRNLKKTPTTRW